VAALSAQEKVFRLLIQDTMQHSANTKRQAIADLKWLDAHILHEDISPPRVKKLRTLPPLFSKKEVAFEYSQLPISYQFMGWWSPVSQPCGISQYVSMIPPKATSPLDVLGAVEVA
jgi:hypothetical protein